ncbi:MAG: SoxR reducing system RseC family protein [Clostridia bacterium]|nr:SoxR reducing system RseC family protein [Clostridia bacterium]
MNGVGDVIALREGMAEVMVKRESACGMMHEGGCGECHGCDSALRSIEIWMENTAGAKVGDRVEFASPSRNILVLALLVFAVPLLVMVGAYFLAKIWLPEPYAVLCSIVSAAAWFVVLRIFDQKLGAYGKCEIVKVLVRPE